MQTLLAGNAQFDLSAVIRTTRDYVLPTKYWRQAYEILLKYILKWSSSLRMWCPLTTHPAPPNSTK